MRTEKVINIVSILPGIQQVVGVSEVLYGIALGCFHAFQKASPEKNFFLNRDVRIIMRGFARCIPLFGTIFSIYLLKKEYQRERQETRKAYTEAIDSIIDFLAISPEKQTVRQQKLMELLHTQLALQEKKLDFSSQDSLIKKIKNELKKKFKNIKNAEYPFKLLDVIGSSDNLTCLLLADLQLDYGIKMKTLRKNKYISSPESNFDKDWFIDESLEELEKSLEGYRSAQCNQLFYSSNSIEFKDCSTDLLELVTSGNVQALTTTFYLSFTDKTALLSKVSKRVDSLTLEESGYKVHLDLRNITENKEVRNDFLKNKKFILKGASEFHLESIDYTMEIGELKEDGFRHFQKGYLVYMLANPTGKMVRFELPIDLSPFEFESEVGVSETIRLMLQFFFNASKVKKEDIENLFLTLTEGSKGRSDIEKLLNQYEKISIWAKNTAEELGSLYEKIYLSLGEATPLSSIQNLDDEMPLYFIFKLCDENEEIKTAYHKYLAQLNLMKLAVIEKQPFAKQLLLKKLKSALLEKIPEEHLGYISHYLNTEIQNVSGLKQPYLNELTNKYQLFLGEEKAFPKGIQLALMHPKIAREMVSFIRSCQSVKEENLKIKEVDLEKYHNKRLLSLKEELEQLIASQFPAETDGEMLGICNEFLQELFHHATLQDV